VKPATLILAVGSVTLKGHSESAIFQMEHSNSATLIEHQQHEAPMQRSGSEALTGLYRSTLTEHYLGPA